MVFDRWLLLEIHPFFQVAWNHRPSQQLILPQARRKVRTKIWLSYTSNLIRPRFGRSVMRKRWLYETWHWVVATQIFFVIFTPNFGGDGTHFDAHIFQKGKHQLDDFFMFTSVTLPQIRNDFVSFWNRTELDWMIAMSPGNIMEDFGR